MYFCFSAVGFSTQKLPDKLEIFARLVFKCTCFYLFFFFGKVPVSGRTGLYIFFFKYKNIFDTILYYNDHLQKKFSNTRRNTSALCSVAPATSAIWFI